MVLPEEPPCDGSTALVFELVFGDWPGIRTCFPSSDRLSLNGRGRVDLAPPWARRPFLNVCVSFPLILSLTPGARRLKNPVIKIDLGLRTCRAVRAATDRLWAVTPNHLQAISAGKGLSSAEKTAWQ